MHVFRRGVAGHTIVGRSFADNTIYRRDPPFPKHSLPFPIGPPIDHSTASGKKKGKDPQANAPANTPSISQFIPPFNPPPSNGGGVSPPSGNTPSLGGNGSPAPAPPVVVPQKFRTGSTDTSPPGSSGGSSTTSSRAIPSAVTDGGVTPTTSDDSLGADNSGSGANDPLPSSQGGVANTGVANAGNVPINTRDTVSQISGGSNTLSAGATSPTPTGNATNNATSATSAEQGHISTGAMVVIVMIFVSLFLALLVFFLRRRSRGRRIEQADTWWFARNRTSQAYGDRNSADILANPRSVRSSFATTLDHSAHAFSAPLPPMAEVGRVNASSRYHTEVPDNRFSIGSNHSENSQFLFVDLRNSLEDRAATTGHSPSESFAFPKPPSPIADRTSAYSRPYSNRGISTTMKRPGNDDIPHPALVSVPPTPTAVPLIGDDPFASNPFPVNNPFEDPKHPAAPTVLTTAFAEEETIHRPFQRTPQDEVTVSTIDCLRESGPASVAAKHVSSYGDEGTFSAI
jgi:hypothetical protein